MNLLNDKGNLLEERITAVLSFSFAVAFGFAILFLAVAIPHPSPWTFFVFRILLTLTAVGISTLAFSMSLTSSPFIKLGSAMIFGGVIYFINPPWVVAALKEDRTSAVLSNLSNSLQNDSYADVEKASSELASMFPRCRVALYWQGVYREEIADYAVALSHFKKASELKHGGNCPDETFSDADLYGHLSLAFEGTGSLSEAYEARIKQKNVAKAGSPSERAAEYGLGRTSLALWLENRSQDSQQYLRIAHVSLSDLVDDEGASEYLKIWGRYHLACVDQALAKIETDVGKNEELKKEQRRAEDIFRETVASFRGLKRFFFLVELYQGFNADRFVVAGAPMRCASNIATQDYFIK